MFTKDFSERTDVEQYVWTEDTVQRMLKSLEFTSNCCCLTTPSLGVGFHKMGRNEAVLDIDTRFNYLPKFRYFDLQQPVELDEHFDIIIMDPPFFYISLEVMRDAVMTIAKGNTNIKLIIGFLKREEPHLLRAFSEFKLKRTNFVLEYSTVKESKWGNYCLYSNVDLPGIKRL